MAERTWKLNFTERKEIKIEQNLPGVELSDDSDEEEEAGDPVYEEATVQIEILRVPGQDKYCLDIQRKSGDAKVFYGAARQFMNKLEHCNN